ncbi:MAG: hypothetical protein ABFR50_12280, partial [Candidatus Fermentibacteria bacterium]
KLAAPVPDGVVHALRMSSGGRDDIIEKLKSGRKVPTLLNLRYLTGWRKVSWFYALLWLVLTGQHPLRRE